MIIIRPLSYMHMCVGIFLYTHIICILIHWLQKKINAKFFNHVLIDAYIMKFALNSIFFHWFCRRSTPTAKCGYSITDYETNSKGRWFILVGELNFWLQSNKLYCFSCFSEMHEVWVHYNFPLTYINHGHNNITMNFCFWWWCSKTLCKCFHIIH